MATMVWVPRTGYGASDAVIGEWLKAEGDSVQEGEVIATAESEKATVEVQAPASGILRKILVPAGASVPVGQPVAIIADTEEDIAELLAGAGTLATEGMAVVPGNFVDGRPSKGSSSRAESASERGEVRATPAARRVAREHEIDLSLVPGRGPNGMISKEDVLSYIEENEKPGAPSVGTSLPQDVTRPGVLGDRVIPLSGMRKVIAERMAHSKHVAAHVTTTILVDLTDLVSLKQSLKRGDIFSKPRSVSLTAFIVKAAGRALRDYPVVNSSLTSEGIVLKSEINIGVAVSLESGLTVPVVRNVDAKDVFTISEEIDNLAGRAREGSLTPEDLNGGTFTVSNAGMYDVEVFTPIIKQPESAILGVASVADRPAVVNGQIAIRKMVNLCLSYDHRVFDGAVAASFLRRIKELLQAPIWLVMDK